MAITSTDNCDTAPTLSYTIEDTEPDYTCADGAGTYVITRTFHAVSTDHCGNTAEASCTQILTVVDVTAPVVTQLECPADTTVMLDASCSAEFGTDLLGLPTIVAEDGLTPTPPPPPHGWAPDASVTAATAAPTEASASSGPSTPGPWMPAAMWATR